MELFLRNRKGESFSGDRHIVEQLEDSKLFVTIDAVGHGEEASRVADIATDTIKQQLSKGLVDIIQTCQSALLNTRGVVICFALYLPKNNRVYYYGVGNIRCLLISRSRVIQVNSIPGIFGTKNQTVNLSQLEVSPQTQLLMFTDGIDALPSAIYPLLRSMNSRHIINFLSHEWSGQDDICCLCESLNG